MIIDWDADEIIHEINKIARAESNPYETGYNTVKCKRDLYTILWHIQDCLEKCSTYQGEAEWIKQQEANRTLERLKQP